MADKRLLVATVNILKHLPPNEKKIYIPRQN